MATAIDQIKALTLQKEKLEAKQKAIIYEANKGYIGRCYLITDFGTNHSMYIKIIGVSSLDSLNCVHIGIKDGKYDLTTKGVIYTPMDEDEITEEVFLRGISDVFDKLKKELTTIVPDATQKSIKL